MNTRPTPAPGAEWAKLLQRVARGDADALATLYDESAALVFGLVRRIVWDPADAEEITAEIFGQIWSRAGSYEPRLGSASAWLLTVARNRAVDHLRQVRRRGITASMDEIEDLAAEDDIEEQTQREQARHQVRGALAGIGPEQRLVIELAFFSGLSHVEIARQLALPLGTVKTRIRLGMKKLQRVLVHDWPASESGSDCR